MEEIVRKVLLEAVVERTESALKAAVLDNDRLETMPSRSKEKVQNGGIDLPRTNPVGNHQNMKQKTRFKVGGNRCAW